MEKFAIDLDKVLDDFEFNEDCAEQIASVNPSNNASASVAKCNFESPSLKTYNYHVIEPGKINKELDVSALETHKDAQQVNKENRFLNDKEKATDNLNYSKEEPTIGTNDSINHFHPDNCENDSKIVQKQGIMPYDSDQLPSTIRNEVSQKLQKQQNGSSNSKIDNRYDNKLNQPNIKPSVSNVFNSLNEYINAPSGNLDYIHPMLGAQKIGCNIEYNSTQNVSALCAKSTITTHSELVKNITKDTSIEHGGASSITDIVIGTGVSNYQGFTVPVTIGSLVTHNTNTEKDSTSEVAIRNSEEMSSEKQLSTNVTITAIDGNDTKYEYADLPINSGIQESQVIIDSGSKREVENENIYNQSTLVYVSENIHDNERGQIAQVGSDKSTHECLHTQNEQSTTADVTETESKTNKTIIEVCADESDLKMKEESSHSSDKYIGSLDSLHKPFGFSSINDLSEEELTKYLAELEEEEKLNENNNMCQDSSMSGSEHIVSAYVVQSTSKDQKSDYTSETPVFENITIGELPSMPQEELKEKSKKFPVIDYSKEKAEEEVLNNFVEKQHLQEHVDQTKNIRDKESTLKEHKWKSLNKTESESVENADSKELELPATTEGNSLIDRGSSIIPERKCMADLKDTQSIQEHHTYNINVDQGSLSNVKTEIQLKETKEVALNSEQYKPSCDVKAQNDIDHDCEETNTLNDNAEYSNLATPKPVELSTESSMNEGTDESEKPVRPQTLDIVLTNNPDEPETHGSTSDTPSRQTQSSIEGMKDDCQGSSPDALDNSLLEFSSVLGKQPPYWVPDSLAPSCMLCEVKFTVLKRRHHCRACGKVLCNKCCSMKYKLEYQGNIDSRVCVSCYQLLTKAETDQGIGEWSSGYSSYMGTNDINSPQLAGGLPPPPTVMVPVGVLKREGGTKSRPEGSKSVMFSDGIRPGCDLTELDMSWDLKPPYRKPSNKRIPTPGSSLPSTTTKRQNLPRLDPNTESYIPQDPNALPPTVTIHKGQVSYHVVTDADLLYKTLKNECEPPVMFAINRNLYAYVKITYLNCCVNKICWNVTSRGLACVGQDEVILLVETLPDETRIPKDLLIFINQLYIEAFKGNTVSELGFSIYQGGNLLSSREHAGFLFIRQTLQCLQKIILPPAPFLVGLLVHRWETPWAKVFPLRLLLRLGAEYRYYPCPLVSVRFRDALYFEIGHTVMKVLADFRNFGYTLPGVRGLTIHLRNRMTDVMFPRNRYDQVIKGLNNSNDHVLAYASNFSISADSHLVCIQTNTGDESSYQTQAINIHNKPRTVTGASFIVINGALKSSMGLSAKSSIVEDGLMVEIMPEKMEALKAALKNMQDFSIGCGRQGAPEPDETVNIKWIDNDVQFNLGVKSPIDGQLMDGIPSIRVHSGTDYKGTSRFIRWTEVFIIKSDDHPSGVHDPVDINKLSGNIAKATCTALVKLLDLLATAGLTKLGVRTTIHPDNVGYEAGSEGTKLPPIYMNSLDNELIQVLHKAAQSSQDNHTVLELIFYILDD